MTSTTPLLLLLLTALLLAPASASRFHSAKCLAERRKCTREVARLSEVCRPFMAARAQSARCKKIACLWCEVPGKRNIFPCSTRVVRRICYGSRRTPRPTPTRRSAPTPSRRPPSPPPVRGGCVWTGGTKVVVDVGRATPVSGWTRVSRRGMRGLVWMKGRTGGLDKAGSGKICFNVKVAESGMYYTTVVSAAPHRTDNNDMWMSSSNGWRLLRGGQTRSLGKNTWAKAYQNMGELQVNNVISSVDFMPHSFIVPGVKAGRVFQVCISGRSSKFEVFKIILVKCSGNNCTAGSQKANVANTTPSRCS